ncbi:MAG: ABC transporter permease [Candidatus Cloacimonetes bacterium]|nr:ABC transporter permease [Candidatus Cloacimonadota bacterium]
MIYNSLIINSIYQLGSYISFTLTVLSKIPKIFNRFYEFTKQLRKMGYDSLLLITVTSGFTGLVTAVQASYQTRGYIPQSLIGVMVGKSTMTELAPVLTALVLSGKIGAAIAAEIGTMKVSEQIDAMKSMGVDPNDYLYLPRIIAGIIILPLLTIYANLIGIVSAFFVSKLKYDLNAYTFFVNMKNYFRPMDLWGGLVKAFFFGLVITSIACYCGSRTEGGAEGVGKVATLSVVYSSILILLMDFIVAAVLFGGY